MYLKWSLRLAVLVASIAWGSSYSVAETGACKPPTAQKQVELTSYVAKRYHLAQETKVSVVESVQANDDCFWRVRFEIVPTKREIVLYLSPDGQYLMPTLYDVRVDPLVEEQRIADDLMKSLMAGDPPTRGPANAPVTIIEFADFQCQFCKRFADVWENQLSSDERKNLRIIFREFPLSTHSWANDAAEVAECVALQNNDAFWKVHDYLFSNQQIFNPDNLREKVIAFALANPDVDKRQLQPCLDKRLSEGPVSQDVDLARKNGIDATPTLFINGVRSEGAKDIAQLREIIASARRSAPPASGGGVSTASAASKISKKKVPVAQ